MKFRLMKISLMKIRPVKLRHTHEASNERRE
jgi:hypothetical protein